MHNIGDYKNLLFMENKNKARKILINGHNQEKMR